ncbi:hypothetical protein HDU79_000131 [Rhizoclosmatium sp. JEL0117]|nr:hypothetical protein HDU79_000131 [Rhizoclosmatium sp. JEL0117]
MRYMYIAGQVDFVSKVYFSLSLVGMISPKYVYLGTNVPKKITTDMSLLSPNLSILNQNVTLMAQYMQGFISLVSLRPPATNPPWLQPFYDQFSSVAKLDKGFADDLYLNSGKNITTYYAVSNAFDCVMTLAMGFDKLLKDNPKYSSQNLASRSLSQYSNYTQFLNTSYTGLTSSSLNLNSLGDLISPYYVYSYTGQASGNSFVSQSFAVTDIGGTQIGYFNGSSPIFFGGSTIPPPDGPAVIQLNYLVNDAQSSNGKAIIAVTTLGLVLSGCTLAFFVVFRNDKKMKMTSVPECIVTIVGSAFCYISLAFHLNGVTRSACVARIWLAVFGYMLMIQPIIMKNSRLYIVLKSKKRLDGVLLTLIGRCVVAGGILIELGLLSYWAATSNTGPFQMVVSYNAFDICNSVNKSGSIAIEILQGYTLFIHCLLFVLAYFLKDADPKFNESPALSTVGAMNAILYAVMVILPSNPTINMDLIQCICIWLGTTLTLLIFFGSKMYEVIFDTIAEKGLLKMSIKSSFEAGKSTASGFGAKSGFAAAKPKTQNSTMNPSKISTQDISKQDSSRQDSSRAKSNSNLRATAKSQLSRAKSGRELVPPRSGIPTAAPLTGQTLKKAHSTKDMKSHHRPCHCKQILGIHVFKIKTAKTQIIWNAWNGGVCYFNNTRKRTWMSIATLDKVHTITIMSTVRCERITGVNQVSISDFPSFKFHVILEFKDVKTLESFMSEFQAHKTFMLTQRD